MSTIGQIEKQASNIPLSPRKSPMIRPHSPAGQLLPIGNSNSSNSHHVIVRSTSDGMSYSPDLWRLRANSLHNDLVTPVPPSPFRSRSASESSPSVPPLVPWLSNPPLSPASATAAANAALAASEHERNRAAQQQKLEESMSVEELRVALKRERAYSCKLAVDLATLRCAAVSSQAEAEAYEEGRINCLMRRLSSLAKEKGRLIVELEQEEEMVRHFQSLIMSCFSPLLLDLT
jgi:hypothetical protein